MNSDNQNTEMNIRIDWVVLDGISLTSYEQQRLKESIETALTAMFLINGIPSGIEKAPVRIKGGAIQLQEQKPAPGQLGKQVAESIYNGLASEQGNK